MSSTSIIIISILVVLIIFIKTDDTKKLKQNDNDADEDEKDIEVSNENSEKDYPYVRKYLLTKNEWKFYKDLKRITDKYHIHILSKVRINDLIDVKKGTDKSALYRTKIAQKHFDFVLANPDNLAILCAIELDDSTHDNNIKTQQRDFFVNHLCEVVSLPLIRIRNAEGLEDKICETLKINKK